MGRKGPKPRPIRPTKDPGSLPSLVVRHLGVLRVKGYSANTVRARGSYFKTFLAWCAERSLERPGDVTRAVLVQYQRWLFHQRTRRGERRSTWDQSHHVTTLRGFFRWLLKDGHVATDPAAELELPKQPQHLPRGLLTLEEIEAVIAGPDVKEPLGIRDRAILEVLYSTGLRRAEVTKLRLGELDLERGTLMVTEGKGGYDRVVPIGPRAMTWLDKYLVDVRPGFAGEEDDGTVFLTSTGEALHPCHLGALVKEYVEAAGVKRRGSCHLFRHAMATLMLENGADVRYVQEMLGHRRLTTTQVYTHVSVKRLKEVHTATHPAALLEKRR